MNNFRQIPTNAKVGPADSQNLGFNQQAGAHKMLGPILGNVLILGALGTAKSATQRGKLIAVFNNSATVAFAKTGDASVTAPTGGADGICLTPNAYTIIALFQDTHIICNAATCFGYEIVDDTFVNPNSGVNT
jgi:hypothetical protein